MFLHGRLLNLFHIRFFSFARSLLGALMILLKFMLITLYANYFYWLYIY